MERRNFLKNLGLGIAGLFPFKEISSATVKSLTDKTSLPLSVSITLPGEQSMIDFAKQFAKNYKIFSVGHYSSDDREHSIWYREKITDDKTGEQKACVVEIDHHTKLIHLDKNKLLENDKFTEVSVFLFIMWGYYKGQLPSYPRTNYMIADLRSIKQTLEHYPFGKKEICLTIISVFRNSPDSETELFNQNRYKEIEKYIASA